MKNLIIKGSSKASTSNANGSGSSKCAATTSNAKCAATTSNAKPLTAKGAAKQLKKSSFEDTSVNSAPKRKITGKIKI